MSDTIEYVYHVKEKRVDETAWIWCSIICKIRQEIRGKKKNMRNLMISQTVGMTSMSYFMGGKESQVIVS